MVKDKKTIKKEILDKFRSISEESDYILPPRWLQSDYVDTLTSVERKVFEQAIRELVSKGLIEQVNEPSPTLRLTEKGADLIY
jgi:glutaredoxin 2